MSSDAATTQNQPATDTIDEQNPQVSSSPTTHSEVVIADTESTYAASTTSTKTSSSFGFGSLSKLPLLSRSRSSSAGSSTSSDTTLRTKSSKSRTDDKHGLLGTIFRKSKAEGDAKGKSRSQASGEQQPEEAGQPTDGQKQAARDPVKTVPSGKPPAVTFGDLAYRYGAPGASGSRRL